MVTAPLTKDADPSSGYCVVLSPMSALGVTGTLAAAWDLLMGCVGSCDWEMIIRLAAYGLGGDRRPVWLGVTLEGVADIKGEG